VNAPILPPYVRIIYIRKTLQEDLTGMRIKIYFSSLKSTDIHSKRMQSYARQDLLRCFDILPSNRYNGRAIAAPGKHVCTAETLDLDLAPLHPILVKDLHHLQNGAVHILEASQAVAVTRLFQVTSRQLAVADTTHAQAPAVHGHCQTGAEHCYNAGRLVGNMHLARFQIDTGQIFIDPFHCTFL
jgi:hypothetical protein